jgi:tRNA (guanine37-N1)-methyltransferase
MSWQAHYITLFPEMFPGSLGQSLAGRAHEAGIWDCQTHDLRAHGEGKHKNVDDTPSGGGAGMVLRADVAGAAIEQVRAHAPSLPVILPSPRGEAFTQDLAIELAQGPGAIFFCNRFEGVDERVIEALECREVSLGDYILSGGEPAALAMSDAIIRLLPGVMGSDLSAGEESFANGLLEYPHYTRPATWQGLEIPDILTSGDHGKIAQWREQKAEEITQKRRPDLWAKHLPTKK